MQGDSILICLARGLSININIGKISQETLKMVQTQINIQDNTFVFTCSYNHI